MNRHQVQAALPGQNINFFQRKFDALFRREDANPPYRRAADSAVHCGLILRLELGQSRCKPPEVA
jgi:hypothetical protein